MEGKKQMEEITNERKNKRMKTNEIKNERKNK